MYASTISQHEQRKGQNGERNSTHNDSSNRIHPVVNVFSKEHSNEANDVGDNIKKVILGISFDDFIGKSTTINNQKKFYQSHWEHYAHNPSLLLFAKVEVIILKEVSEKMWKIVAFQVQPIGLTLKIYKSLTQQWRMELHQTRTLTSDTIVRSDSKIICSPSVAMTEANTRIPCTSFITYELSVSTKFQTFIIISKFQCFIQGAMRHTIHSFIKNITHSDSQSAKD